MWMIVLPFLVNGAVRALTSLTDISAPVRRASRGTDVNKVSGVYMHTYMIYITI